MPSSFLDGFFRGDLIDWGDIPTTLTLAGAVAAAVYARAAWLTQVKALNLELERANEDRARLEQEAERLVRQEDAAERESAQLVTVDPFGAVEYNTCRVVRLTNHGRSPISDVWMGGLIADFNLIRARIKAESVEDAQKAEVALDAHLVDARKAFDVSGLPVRTDLRADDGFEGTVPPHGHVDLMFADPIYTASVEFKFTDAAGRRWRKNYWGDLERE